MNYRELRRFGKRAKKDTYELYYDEELCMFVVKDVTTGKEIPYKVICITKNIEDDEWQLDTDSSDNSTTFLQALEDMYVNSNAEYISLSDYPIIISMPLRQQLLYMHNGLRRPLQITREILQTKWRRL